jgi:hypothetical protein
MAGSLDFPFGSGVVSSPISAGTLLKPDSTVDLGDGFSVANIPAGDYPIGEAMYDSSSNPIEAASPGGGLSSTLVYSQPVKLWFPTYLALITGGGSVTRGNPLFGITGGFLSVTNPGGATPIALAGSTGTVTPGQLFQVYKIYVS